MKSITLEIIGAAAIFPFTPAQKSSSCNSKTRVEPLNAWYMKVSLNLLPQLSNIYQTAPSLSLIKSRRSLHRSAASSSTIKKQRRKWCIIGKKLAKLRLSINSTVVIHSITTITSISSNTPSTSVIIRSTKINMLRLMTLHPNMVHITRSKMGICPSIQITCPSIQIICLSMRSNCLSMITVFLSMMMIIRTMLTTRSMKATIIVRILSLTKLTTHRFETIVKIMTAISMKALLLIMKVAIKKRTIILKNSPPRKSNTQTEDALSWLNDWNRWEKMPP